MNFLAKVLWYVYLQFKYGRIHKLRQAIFHFMLRRKMKHFGNKVVLHPNIEIRHPELISIGDYTNVNHNSELYGGGGIEIGSGTMLAYYVTIISDTRTFKGPALLKSKERAGQRIRKKVKIGDDVWIGARAIVLPGVTIADHAVVAAGAIVTKDVHKWEIVAGNPARVVGSRLNTTSSDGKAT